jgi:hypothetical protein
MAENRATATALGKKSRDAEKKQRRSMASLRFGPIAGYVARDSSVSGSRPPTRGAFGTARRLKLSCVQFNRCGSTLRSRNDDVRLLALQPERRADGEGARKRVHHPRRRASTVGPRIEYAPRHAFFLFALRRLHVPSQAGRAPDHFGINVFCLEGFDPATVPVRGTEGIGMSAVDPNARSEWSGRREAG